MDERRTRPDRATASMVDAVAALTDEHGRDKVANALRALGVRFPVIVRVLAEPDRRRRPADRQN